ncbi:MAG: hypothetical protein RBS39_08580 [Phycisphaerales bacterium]|nr:hypothetical protein [Phycisphaerales bacterium]
MLTHRRCRAVALSFGIMVAPAWGQVVFVRADAPPGGDGLTWATALRDVQPAIDLADALGFEVWVAQGVYVPNGASRSASFTLRGSVVLRGGFAGTEQAASEAHPDTFVTVLSGDRTGDGPTSDDLYSVVTPAAGSTPTLEGVVVRGGRADGSSTPTDRGAGVRVIDADLTLRNVVIERCWATRGAGAYLEQGTLNVIESEFRQNTASLEGGGILAYGGLSVDASEFHGNTASFGGAISACCGTNDIRDSLFVSNVASNGGAVQIPSGTARIASCDFLSNAASEGGALSSTSNNTYIAACRFISNTGTSGGAMWLIGRQNIASCVFVRNVALQRGGAVYAQGNTVFANNTVYANAALIDGGGFATLGGLPKIDNCVLWSNTDNAGGVFAAQVRAVGGVPSVNTSCVEGWTLAQGGVGNMGSAPMFVGVAGPDGILGTIDDDPQLSVNSPAVEAASLASLPADLADVDRDGDTSERLPLDASRRTRIRDANLDRFAVLDMGGLEAGNGPRKIHPNEVSGD